MKYYYEKWSLKTVYTAGKWVDENNRLLGGFPHYTVWDACDYPRFRADSGFLEPTSRYEVIITDTNTSAYAWVSAEEIKHVMFDSYQTVEPIGTWIRVYTMRATKSQIKNELMTSSLIGLDGAYPNNGISGNYWYVKKGEYIPPRPSISGQDSDLGVIDRDYTIAYTATHESGCMVTEQIDSTTLRIYTPSGESTLTIPESIWISLKNGSHTLTITAAAQDGTSGVSVRKYTFTKRERLIKFTLSEPIRCKDRVSVLTMRLLGNLGKAQLKVHACNNALETDPAWEDISSNVQSETEYTFINNTGQTGLNIMVEIQGDEGQGIYLSGINLKYKEGKDGIW